MEYQWKESPSARRILKDARINEDLLYKGMTCPSRLGFLKKTPIRKGLGLQGKGLGLQGKGVNS